MRKRHIVQIILKEHKQKSLKQLLLKSNLDIYNTDNNFFSEYSKNNEHYVSSVYLDNCAPGTEIEKRVFCQNLEKLTFADETFDIIITSEVLEHVRNYRKAFEEIHRVLKKGGKHIFTIPFNFDKDTVVRVDTSTKEDINILPPEYHLDGLRGKIIAYRTFGIDLYKTLSEIGFDTTVHFSTIRDYKFCIYNSFVFCSEKL
jgi:SAM-dependent methyltransferase